MPQVQILRPAVRRAAAPFPSLIFWAVICAAIVIVAHAFTPNFATRLGPYGSGLITLAAFLVAAAYAVRRRLPWLSVRWLRLAQRLPRPLAARMVVMDRLETWRVMHITVGVLALLPLWWHTEHGRANMLELVLLVSVLALVASGFLGTMVQELLPPATLQPDLGVRLTDIQARCEALFVQAEEAVLGHSEALTHAYIERIRPLLIAAPPARQLLWATVAARDPATARCAKARGSVAALGPDLAAYDSLVKLAELKVRLEHNRFNLRLGTGWLRFHLALALLTGCLVIFHLAGVFYFLGL